MAEILYLFIDSNVLLECKALNELPWVELGNYDEFHLIVCRTVQREIDDHKSESRDRVQDRARKASSLFGKALENTQGYYLVRGQNPIVKMFLDTSSKPNETHTSHISKDKADDEIVAFCYGYAKEHPERIVRLLTDDTGPKITAKANILPYISVAEHWKLPPQSGKANREIIKLQKELQKYQRSEPQFKTRWIDTQGNAVKRFQGEYSVYQPLEDVDIDGLVQALKQRFPIASDFSQPRSIFSSSSIVLSSMYAHVPPTDDEIENYTNRQYPHWIEKCEDILRRLHHSLQQSQSLPHLCLTCQNDGSRPAEQVLVKISTMGNIYVFPRDNNREDLEAQGTEAEITLPQPPRPPRGQITFPWSFGAFSWPNPSFPASMSSSLFGRELILQDASVLHDTYNDGDFFYSSGRPSKPVDNFSLECQLWRHATGHQKFCIEVSPGQHPGLVKGAIECEIHATNLTQPIKEIIPVEITVQLVDIRPYANELIGNLSK